MRAQTGQHFSLSALLSICSKDKVLSWLRLALSPVGSSPASDRSRPPQRRSRGSRKRRNHAPWPARRTVAATRKLLTLQIKLYALARARRGTAQATSPLPPPPMLRGWWQESAPQGHESSRPVHKPRSVSTRCSQLSTTRSNCLVSKDVSQGVCERLGGTLAHPKASATAFVPALPQREEQAPPATPRQGRPRRSSALPLRARRVFPEPPAPVRIKSRVMAS